MATRRPDWTPAPATTPQIRRPSREGRPLEPKWMSGAKLCACFVVIQVNGTLIGLVRERLLNQLRFPSSLFLIGAVQFFSFLLAVVICLIRRRSYEQQRSFAYWAQKNPGQGILKVGMAPVLSALRAMTWPKRTVLCLFSPGLSPLTMRHLCWLRAVVVPSGRCQSFSSRSWRCPTAWGDPFRSRPGACSTWPLACASSCRPPR